MSVHHFQRYLSSYKDTILIPSRPLNKRNPPLEKIKHIMTSASSAPILCNHSCDRDTMVVQCRLHQLNLRYSSGRLFTIVVVCLMIVVLSAPPLLPINLMHQSSSHQSTLMIASTPSPCDSGVIYNQIFNLLPCRPNLVSVYLKHNALHKI